MDFVGGYPLPQNLPTRRLDVRLSDLEGVVDFVREAALAELVGARRAAEERERERMPIQHGDDRVVAVRITHHHLEARGAPRMASRTAFTARSASVLGSESCSAAGAAISCVSDGPGHVLPWFDSTICSPDSSVIRNSVSRRSQALPHRTFLVVRMRSCEHTGPLRQSAECR